ncbi:MAG: 6-carboxytetrahydropterin synthase [Gemmatimonadota bacterium]
MSTASLTRVARFSAAHRYHRPEWTEADNRRVFGPCANPVGHGHDYVLEVTVHGSIDPVTGFSADLAALDAILRREVIEPLDHQHINHAVPAFGDGGLIPTCENLLVWLWDRIAPALPAGVRMGRLRLREGHDLWVDYEGPDADG